MNQSVNAASMISYTEAQSIISSLAHSFGREKLPLDEAVDRVLAEDIFADRDYPPFNRAAMDGFAIRCSDLQAGITEFEIIDVLYAGSTTNKELSSGTCFKIMTGAACPPAADAVVRREDAVIKGNKVSFTVSDIRPYQNIARKGEDMQKGTGVLQKGTKCSVSVIGILASLGYQEVWVEALPTVAIITTGDEVRSIEQSVTDVQIRNSNVHVLKALLKKNLLAPVFIRHVPDNKEQLTEAFAAAMKHDIVIACGGVSAGDADYVPGVLTSLGITPLFHKVAIRPGKPIWCGHKESKMVFALPGNPFSCLVTFTLFIRYYLERCFGLPAFSLSLPLKEGRKQKVALDEFFPVKISGTPSSLLPVALNGSGDIRIGVGADALALHPAHAFEIHNNEAVTAIFL